MVLFYDQSSSSWKLGRSHETSNCTAHVRSGLGVLPTGTVVWQWHDGSVWVDQPFEVVLLAPEQVEQAVAKAATAKAAVPADQSMHAAKLQDLSKNVGFISAAPHLAGGDTKQLQGLTWFRKLLSIETSPPIKEVIDAGVVPRFVHFLTLHTKPQMQFEAAWTLTNIASGDSSDSLVVLNSGALPKFVQLLDSPNADVSEQAAWALGNLAGDSPATRDTVLTAGALPPLVALLFKPDQKLSLYRNATWTLSNFCRGKPAPAPHLLLPAFPCLKHMLASTDEEVLTDACWAWSHLSNYTILTNDRIQDVVEAGVVPRLIELLGACSISSRTSHFPCNQSSRCQF